MLYSSVSGYMEVVCLILVPMLASQPCLHAFDVPTSSFIFIENVLLFLFLLFFFLNGVNIFVDCRNVSWCKLYII